jgi:hypothetical protein
MQAYAYERETERLLNADPREWSIDACEALL